MDVLLVLNKNPFNCRATIQANQFGLFKGDFILSRVFLSSLLPSTLSDTTLHSHVQYKWRTLQFYGAQWVMTNYYIEVVCTVNCMWTIDKYWIPRNLMIQIQLNMCARFMEYFLVVASYTFLLRTFSNRRCDKPYPPRVVTHMPINFLRKSMQTISILLKMKDTRVIEKKAGTSVDSITKKKQSSSSWNQLFNSNVDAKSTLGENFLFLFNSILIFFN